MKWWQHCFGLYFSGRPVCIPAVWPLRLQWDDSSLFCHSRVGLHRMVLWYALLIWLTMSIGWTRMGCLHISEDTLLMKDILPVGADRLYDNVKDMIGYRPWPLMKYCWKYLAPVICTVSISKEGRPLFTLARCTNKWSVWLPGLKTKQVIVDTSCQQTQKTFSGQHDTLWKCDELNLENVNVQLFVSYLSSTGFF